MEEVRPMQTTQEVGAAPRVDGTRVSAAGDAINAANCKKETPTAKSAAFGDEPWKSSSEKDQRRAPYRTPSPEYVDAVQDPEQVNQGEAMGETTKPGDTNEVEGGQVAGTQRLALPRDLMSSSSSDLGGVGIKVAGGVKCDKCGHLHTVITDVTADLPSEAGLHKGLAVLEWCGHSVDGASYEEVRRVLSMTKEETTIELAVKECRGPSPEVEDKRTSVPPSSDTVTSQQSENSLTSLRDSPSTDREQSYTPKSLSPTPSPIRSRTTTPHSHSTESTPSPTPPPSPNLPRRGGPKGLNSAPRPASMDLLTLRPPGEVVAPKFMINDVPTSPPLVVEEEVPSKHCTVESFVGTAPAASIHMSLRYREDDSHLRILLHEVKGKKTKKNGSKNSPNAQGHYFINSYLFPDLEKQGVRACEVLSHVSDLENPQFYIISKKQLKSVALRVVLWEAKTTKNPCFVGEVLVALSDRNAVKLEGHPSWFTMCMTDPNLPPLPSAVLVKRAKKEDIFHKVRRGTGYALQSLRRPMSMGIDALAAENGRLSPSSSLESLESSFKKLQGANVTMPRHTRKERRPLTALFNFSHFPPDSPTHLSPSVQPAALTAAKQNGSLVANTGEGTSRVTARAEIWDETAASPSVPTSPLLTRRTAARDISARRKKLGGILNVLRGSLLPPTHSLDLTSTQRRKRAATEAGDDMVDGVGAGGGDGAEEKKRRWSLSDDVKHRIVPMSPPFTSSATSSPFTSPQRRPLAATPSSSTLDPASTTHRRVQSEIVTGTEEFDWIDTAAPEPERDLSRDIGSTDLLALEKNSGVILSDGSWYSAEEDLKDDENSKDRNIPAVGQHLSTSASKLIYSGPPCEAENGISMTSKGVIRATKLKSKSTGNILEAVAGEERTARSHRPLSRTRCCALSRESSGSSVEDEYATANSRPLSRTSGSDEPGGTTSEETSLDISTRIKAIGRVNAISSQAEFRAEFPPVVGERESGSASRVVAVSGEERISRWRSLEDLLGALPFQKKRRRWLRRNRTHHVFSAMSSPSPLLKRRSSEPAFNQSPPVGSVRLELTFNPETAMIGVRLHEHSLSDTKTDLTVQTHLYSRSNFSGKEGQQNTVSFKKTDYSHTLVASFTCDSDIADLVLQVSLEASGRFFSRPSGHVLLDLGPLLLPSLSCDKQFPLYQVPFYPPNNAHQQDL